MNKLAAVLIGWPVLRIWWIFPGKWEIFNVAVGYFRSMSYNKIIFFTDCLAAGRSQSKILVHNKQSHDVHHKYLLPFNRFIKLHLIKLFIILRRSLNNYSSSSSSSFRQKKKNIRPSTAESRRAFSWTSQKIISHLPLNRLTGDFLSDRAFV